MCVWGCGSVCVSLRVSGRVVYIEEMGVRRAVLDSACVTLRSLVWMVSDRP